MSRGDTDSPVWLTGLLLLINRISHLARLAAGKVGKACRLCETEGYGGRRISQIQGNPNPDAKIHHHHHAPSPIKAAPRQRRLAAASIVRAPIEPTRPHPQPLIHRLLSALWELEPPRLNCESSCWERQVRARWPPSCRILRRMARPWRTPGTTRAAPPAAPPPAAGRAPPWS